MIICTKDIYQCIGHAYVQELKPDQDLGWQIGVEPSRTLIYLQHKLEPIISLDSSDDFVRQKRPLLWVSGYPDKN